MKALSVLISLFSSVSCGDKDDINLRTPDTSEIERLRQQVLKLEGTIDMINNFVASDYSNCNNVNLPAFESKICKITQTSTAEQQIKIMGQLNQVVTIMQKSLYGIDCVNDTDVGCPVAGSITNKISNIESDITAANNAIDDIEVDITALQNSVNSIEDRMDDFNGGGSSIETVITGIQSDLSTLEGRVTAIEDAVSGTKYYEWVFLCNDVTTFHEPVLFRGDKKEVRGYVSSVSNNGMGVISTANSSGTQYLATNVTPTCKFKIYDRITSLKICWKNDNRNATTGQIDTACDSANSFATPLGTCTCVN